MSSSMRVTFSLLIAAGVAATSSSASDVGKLTSSRVRIEIMQPTSCANTLV